MAFEYPLLKQAHWELENQPFVTYDKRAAAFQTLADPTFDTDDFLVQSFFPVGFRILPDTLMECTGSSTLT